MTDTETPIQVTIAVNIGGETKTFEANATTNGDPYDVTDGLLNGLDVQASRWVRETGMDSRRGQR
jgi:hypothetical protein